MTWLLDTHVLLWAAVDSARLPRRAREVLTDDRNALAFSSASLWEVAIKSGLGRPSFDVDVARLRRGLLENGYAEIPVTGEHAVLVRSLPRLHADPFDRMLLAQAIAEDATLLTADPAVARYDGPVELLRSGR